MSPARPGVVRVALLAFGLLATAIALPTLVGLISVDLLAGLRFGDDGLGFVISAFWAVTALTAPWAGAAADRFGWRPLALSGALVVGSCFALIALTVTSLAGLLVVMALAGVGYALCSPTSNLLVMDQAPVRRQASVLGLKQTAPPLLTAIAGLALPTVAHQHGWRAALLLGACIPLAVLVGTAFWPRGTGVAHEVRVIGVGEALSGGAEVVAPRRAAARPLRPVPVVLAAGLGTLSVATLTGFSVLTLVAAGMSPVAAAGAVSAASLVAVLARVGFGRLLDARPADDLRPLIAVMVVASGALALVALGLSGLVGAPVGTALVVLGVLAALVAAWTWPALLLLAVVRRSERAGAASGLLQLGSGIGSAVGPTLFGLISLAGGRSWAWLLMVACTVLAVLLVRRADGPVGSRDVVAQFAEEG